MWQYIIGGFFILSGLFLIVYSWVKAEPGKRRGGIIMGLICIGAGVLGMIATDPFEQ